jgi:hypothetical protein
MKTIFKFVLLLVMGLQTIIVAQDLPSINPNECYPSFVLNPYQAMEQQQLLALLENADDLQAIEAHVNDVGLSSAYARTLLQEDTDYSESLFFPSQVQERNTYQPELQFEHIPFAVYPNPTKDYLIFTASDLFFSQTAVIQVLDVTGRVIYERTLEVGDTTLMIELKDQAAGSYVLNVYADKQQVYTEQVLLQK